MRLAVRGFRSGVLLALVAAAGSIGAHFATRPRPAERLPAPVLAVANDSATMPLQGQLTPVARSELREATKDEAAILVLLDSADIRVCEDLGRQLRELRNRAGSTFPLVIVVDSAALVPIATFVRRERLRPASLMALGTGNVIAGVARVPTPAALVIPRGGGAVAGVGHPRRFANVRVRSFADELSAYLRDAAGSTSPP
jgi:hypothetical protein